MSAKWPKFWIHYTVLTTVGICLVIAAGQVLPAPPKIRLFSPHPAKPAPSPVIKYIPAPEPETHTIKGPLTEKPEGPPPQPEASSRKPIHSTNTSSPPAAEPVEMKNWGMVTKPDAHASTMGQPLSRKIPVATIIQFTDTVKTDGQEMAVCDVHFKDGIQTNICISLHDLQVFHRPLRTASRKEINTRGMRLLIMDGIRKEEARLAKARADIPQPAPEKTNPYESEYKRKKAAYDKFWAEANSLIKQRDNATGAKKTELSMKLTEMKGQDIRVGTEFESIQQKYDQWNKTNKTKAPEQPSDALLKGLKKRLADINTKIANM